MAQTKAEKIARTIRGSAADEEFDLKGFEEEQVTQLVAAAFTEPIVAPNGMFRISFVIGGGKNVRGKYEAALPKYVSQSLLAAGFEEDKGASVSLACQGRFKYQHNTDTDLKNIHVFPRVVVPDEEVAGEGADGEEGEMSPQRICTVCSLETFKGIVDDKVHHFSQRRGLLRLFKATAAQIAVLDEKMIAMEPLTPRETSLYEETQDLPEKMAHLQETMDMMMKEGQLTKPERTDVLRLLATQEADIASALDKASDKKKAKLQKRLDNVKGLHQAVEQAKPVPTVVKHGREINDLKSRIARIEDLEAQNAAGLNALQEKPKLQAKLAALEAEGGWFVDPAMVEKLPPPKAKSKSRSTAASTARPAANDGWTTAPTKSRSGGRSGKAGKGGSAGGMFAGLSIE